MRLSARGRGGNPPRTVSFKIDFWKASDGLIHVATNDPEAADFHVAISDDPSRSNGHPNLYRRLDAYLRQCGAA
jgi:hypothetical protein